MRKIYWYALLMSISVQTVVAAPTPPPTQKTYPTPEAAANAFIHAASEYNVPTLLEILGPGSQDLVSSKDPVNDKNRALAFAAEARKKKKVTLDKSHPGQATLVVGTENWPLPIPIVQVNGKWRFDSSAGRDEILDRRIGDNELNAIALCRGYVEAQKQYASEIHDNSGVNQYAQRIISTPAKHDGLAWKNPDGSWGGPVGHGVAEALEQGYSESGTPFHGYYFKVLKGQGPAAPLGQLDFLINGAMIGGFALVAWPAQYDVTGIQTFIVSYNGVVEQKDLGPQTSQIAQSMEQYNPDASWSRTGDDWAKVDQLAGSMSP